MKKKILLFFFMITNVVLAQQDCSTAIAICGNSNINFSPTGFGNVNESLGGCLATGGENNSVWYKFEVATSGTLTFIISPTSPVDYDWAIYGPNVSCASKGVPIRCNAAGTFGNTGLDLASTNTVAAPGTSTPFCKYLDVLAGETYYLFVDNWVGPGFNGTAPFSLTWGGTATLADPFNNSTLAPNPFISPGVAGANPSDPREISICNTSQSFDFNSLTQGILNNNQGFIVSYHSSSNDALLGINSISSPSNVTAGTVYYYSVVYQNFNGTNTACRKVGAFKFVNKAAVVSITASKTHVCSGENTILTSSLTSGNTWSNGATTQAITVNTAGTYTLTNSNGYCSATTSVTISSSQDPNLQISGDLTICDASSTTLTATTTSAVTYTYLWSTGATAPTITVTVPGNYTVKVTDSNGCSFSKTETVVNSSLASLQNTSLSVCSATSSAVFNLTTSESSIGNITGLTFKFYQNQADAVAANLNFISNPSSFTSSNTILYVLVSLGSCTKIVTLNLVVDLTPTITTQPVNQTVCAGSNVSFNVREINGIGYQWQIESGSGFIDLINNTIYSGVTTNVLNITNAQKSLSGSKYRLIVYSTCVPNLESQVVTLVVSDITVSIFSNNNTCFGIENGAATVTASGGIAPYTYLWSNGATSSSLTGLAPGTYSVQVKDSNLCTVTNSVTITQPAVLDASIEVNNVSCNGVSDGSIVIKPSGGTAPYTYLWNNNFRNASVTGLHIGNYSVVITDANGCTKTVQATITEPSLLGAVLTSKNVNCNGGNDGEATITASGGTAPYSYLWSNGATTFKASALTVGNYTVKVTDAKGCSVTYSVVITEPTAVQFTTKQVKAGCNGAVSNSVIVTASGGTPPYTYRWSNGSVGDKVDNLASGTYSLTLTDAKGCKLTQQVDVVPFADMVLNIDKRNISCNGLIDGAITVTVNGGKAPYTYNWSQGAQGSTVNGLAKGTYSVLITDNFGCTVSQSILIEEPSVLTVTHTQTNVSCYGTNSGVIALNPIGGTSPYTYQWSNGLSTGTISQLVAGTYDVLISDANGCSLKYSATITQPTDVVTPVASNQVFCATNNAVVNDLVVTGTSVKWYNATIGGTPLKGTDLLVSGNYYASQTINGCESYARTVVQVTIQNTAAPTAAVTQSFCSPFIPKISDLIATGSNLKWYSQANSGNLLPASTVLINGATYYVSQTINGCESISRFAVKVNIYPNAPITTSSLIICDVATIQDIAIDNYTSAQLKWYSTSAGGQELLKNQLLTTATYYISTYTYNLCESVRKAVQVTVSTKVNAPSASAQVFCNVALIDDLVVTSSPNAKVNWYDSFTSANPLAKNIILKSGTYYVEQEIAPCKSSRVPVNVQIFDVAAPVMTDFQLCDGATVADLYLAASTTTKYVWYADNLNSNPLRNNYALTTGFYYVAIDNNKGCISKRTKVHVDVNPRPAAPTGSVLQSFNYKATVADLVMNEPDIVWFLSYSDAINRKNALKSNDLLTDGVTYYGVVIDAIGCPSYPVAVTVRINLGVNNLDLAQLKYYPNPVETELIISYLEKIELVEVYTITGQRIAEQKFDTEIVKIDFSSFSSGNYIVKIVSGKESQFVKIVKK